MHRLGARSNETSGRAILARQREGDVGTFHFSDNLARAISHGGRVLVGLIPRPRARSHRACSARRIRSAARRWARCRRVRRQSRGMVEVFDVSVGKYDVAVQSGPSFTTRAEAKRPRR